MPPQLVRSAADDATRSGAGVAADELDQKARAKAVRAAIQTKASEAGIDLRLRRTR